MRFLQRYRAAIIVATLVAAFSLVAVDFAEARRGGGFGSRGARTFDAAPATRTAPNQSQQINRSMTPRQQTNQPAQAGTPAAGTAAQATRGGMMGGMMGGLMGGLLLGGLIGMMMGTGLGGMAGFLGLLLQVGIVVLIVMLVMRFLRSRNSSPAMAGGGSGTPGQRYDFTPASGSGGTAPGAGVPGSGGASAGAGVAGAGVPGAVLPPEPVDAPAGSAEGGHDEIGLTGDDFDAFEQLLVEIQAAFTREDYAGLRDRSTPEIVSFLSEELSENAVNGQRNDVLDVKLLQGDLAEAWREGEEEYASVAMRYESIDVMRDRETGEILEGDEEPTETTEVWTFVRPVGGKWKLSAIQDV